MVNTVNVVVNIRFEMYDIIFVNGPDLAIGYFKLESQSALK